MTSQLSHHNSFFKKFLGDLSVARNFLAIHLPEHLRQQCDLTTLTLCSGSFIEDDLRPHCSDMLYSLKTAHGEGLIYCLIEHQSRHEPMMTFRLMRYAVTAMKRHLEQGKQAVARGDPASVLSRHQVAISLYHTLVGLFFRSEVD